ncbi:MAG: GvpL/GvpF family gas vesicle protein [Pseudomonadota bacterium]
MPNKPDDTTIRAGDGEGIYLFCFARPHVPETLNVSGLDDRQTVSQWTFQGITAVFSKASLEEFCDSEAESRMKDLSWIGPRACRHEEVVQQVMPYSPVLPARFGTIFSSLDSLENLLKIHTKTISQFLDHVTEKEEWSVKGLVDSEKAKEKLYSTTMAAEAERLASLSPGARYFQEKRIHSDIGNKLNLGCKKKLQEIAKNLDQYASDFCTRKMLSRDATGMDMDMIANWAYLVPLNFTEKFCAGVDQANEIYGQDGLTLQLSGPWPPYSFCPSLEIVD